MTLGITLTASGDPRIQWTAFSPRFVSRFKLLSAHATEMTMAMLPIVERIDVLGDVRRSPVRVFVDLLLNPFLLQTTAASVSGLQQSRRWFETRPAVATSKTG